MKLKIIALVLTLFIAVSSFAADTNQSLFNKGEVGVSLATSYVVDRSASFQQDYTFGLIGGVSYFPSKYVGVQAALPFYKTEGVSLSEASAGITLRYPIKNVAPYVSLNGVYNWRDSLEKWNYVAAGGLEVRVNPKWGVFVEYQHRNKDLDIKNGSEQLVGGVKVVF